MKVLYQSLLFIVVFILLFLWEITGYTSYNIQAIALLVLTYGLLSFYRKNIKKAKITVNGYSDILILNTVIILLILSTNGLYSPLFFLLYFLSFGITFVFEPLTVFIFILGLILLFLPETFKNNAIESYIRIGSLLLICPLAFYFGQSYKERTEQQEHLEEMAERAKDAADTIAKDVDEVIKKDEKHMDDDELEKLNEILEETEDLRGEATSE